MTESLGWTETFPRPLTCLYPFWQTDMHNDLPRETNDWDSWLGQSAVTKASDKSCVNKLFWNVMVGITRSKVIGIFFADKHNWGGTTKRVWFNFHSGDFLRAGSMCHTRVWSDSELIRTERCKKAFVGWWSWILGGLFLEHEKFRHYHHLCTRNPVLNVGMTPWGSDTCSVDLCFEPSPLSAE